MIFFDSEQSSVAWWACCLLSIILLGCAMGWISSHGKQVANANAALHQEIEIQQTRLDDLKDDIQTKNARFGKKGTIIQTDSLRLMRSGLAVRSQQIADLKKKKSELTAGNDVLGKEFQVYRSQAIQQLWQDAAGTPLGAIKTRDGKEYSEAVIRRITPAGMEVAHESGRAMIPFRNLSLELQQRFQWQDLNH